jgi:hypothetical protein
MAEAIRPPTKIAPGLIGLLIGILIGLGVAYFLTH